MKKSFLFILILACCALSTSAAKLKYYDALEFTMVGKLMPGKTANPYHRIDTTMYKGFDKKENLQVRETAGMAIAFRTNSRAISVQCDYGEVEWPQNSTGISAHGFDLYIKKDGVWNYAASGARNQETLSKALNLITDMDGEEHECLLYLPLFAEINALKIGVDNNAKIEALPMPFRHRIVIFGSSFTHGTSTSRAGMTYPAQIARATGLQLLGLGCSGHCKMQPYFAEALADVDCDAFIFDCFSNPLPNETQERLFPFIERLQKAHPGKPLIFQHTIHREGADFNGAKAQLENAKIAMADSMMAIALKKYKDVYYVYPNANSPSGDASVDGTHPDNYGYTLWANSVIPQITEILARYGIK